MRLLDRPIAGLWCGSGHLHGCFFLRPSAAPRGGSKVPDFHARQALLCERPAALFIPAAVVEHE